MQTLFIVGSQSCVTRDARCKVMRLAIAPSVMLRVVSTQPGHVDAPYHTALTQIVHCTFNIIGNGYANQRK